MRCLPLPGDEEAEDDPPSPGDVLGALGYVFEATYRLRIAQSDAAMEIRYGNASAITYRPPQKFEHDHWTTKVEWRDGALQNR